MTQTPSFPSPACSISLLAPKRSRFCAVIPVVNEGAKIQNQLRRMQDAGIMNALDVAIADGGSNDGSLDAGFLAARGVRALLVKLVPGRQSTQLRMGFAWALNEGYEGVVTVDGNGKDGVEAIPDFVRALEAGCDFVQGSRHVPGGAAINTPLDRALAVKFVHAPLVSFAARRRYTDTTNGFRAFSARLLSSPDMAIFRDVFRDYNLFFYIAIRAARLGFNVREIPVTRTYPAKGKVPSKISGFKGRIGILRELLLCAGGAYNP